MAIHSSILAWRTPWREEPGRLQSMGSHRVGHDWSDLASTQTEPKEAACDYTVYQSPPNGPWGLVPIWSHHKQTWLTLPMPIGAEFSRVAGERELLGWTVDLVLQLQLMEASIPSLPIGHSFSTSALLTFWAREFSVLCLVGFSSITNLYSWDASSVSPPQGVTATSASRHYQMFPGGQNHPSWEALLSTHRACKQGLWAQILSADPWLSLIFFSLDRCTFYLFGRGPWPW